MGKYLTDKNVVMGVGKAYHVGLKSAKKCSKAVICRILNVLVTLLQGLQVEALLLPVSNFHLHLVPSRPSLQY